MEHIKTKKGLLIVLSGPSGVGKGTLVSSLMKHDDNIVLSVSATTRQPRPGEKNGKDYFFKTMNEFELMKKNGQLLEWDEYCGNYYGTPKDFITSTLNEGRDIVLEITVEGAMAVKDAFEDAVTIFILPPSLAELKDRIVNRSTENQAVIHDRLAEALKEIGSADKYEYLIVNDSVDEAASELSAIIRAEKNKTYRKNGIINSWRNI